jgi:hypothetical protein
MQRVEFYTLVRKYKHYFLLIIFSKYNYIYHKKIKIINVARVSIICSGINLTDYYYFNGSWS